MDLTIIWSLFNIILLLAGIAGFILFIKVLLKIDKRITRSEKEIKTKNTLK